MRNIPDGFHRRLAEIRELALGIPGLTTSRELDFLAMLAACPTASGEILEIGSFRGRSTVALSLAASMGGEGSVVAVDPMVMPSAADADTDAEPERCRALLGNLARCGVAHKVEFHQTFSGELAKRWDRKLRLLWIDGLHTYDGVKIDFDGFAPHLADGAIIAIHDVLHVMPGPIRVFAEDVLLSRSFGAAGLCGAIGWAQYHADPAATRRHETVKSRLYRMLTDLTPYMTYGRVRGWRKLAYKVSRSLVPHGRVSPRRWLPSVDFVGAQCSPSEAPAKPVMGLPTRSA